MNASFYWSRLKNRCTACLWRGRTTCEWAPPPLPCAPARAPFSDTTVSPLNSGAVRLTPTNWESERRLDGGSTSSLNFAPSAEDSSFHVIGASPRPRFTPPRQYDMTNAQREALSHALVLLQRNAASADGFGHCPAFLHSPSDLGSINFSIARLVIVLPRLFLLN